ncbi:pullulanase [Paenibacillus sp. MMS18-CY102]|nr:pullulanase [Paenibacillus sp. MMS18-CY102]MWC30355.1 pullulanase [Paenibacillus sp. MMS18-CY102]
MNVALKQKKTLSFLLIAAMLWSIFGAIPVQANAGVGPVPDQHLRVHYTRADAAYTDLGIWSWFDVAAPSAGWPSGATAFSGAQQDAYGAYLDIPLAGNAKKVGLVVVNRNDGSKDGGDKFVTISKPEVNEVWIKQGSDQVSYYEPVDLPANTVRVHYVRDDQAQSSFGLWLFNDVAAPSAGWPSGATAFQNTDRYGSYIDVPLLNQAKNLGFVVVNRTTGDKDGADHTFSLLDRYNQVWVKQNDNTVYISPYWEQATGLLSAELLSDQEMMLGFTLTDGVTADDLKSAITIVDKNGANVDVQAVALNDDKKTVRVTANIVLDNAPLSVTYMGTTVTASTGWRMLDQMYAYDGNDLGATYNAGSVALKLWAPKASTVTANVYDRNDSTQLVGSVSLSKGAQGVWSATIAPADLGNPAITDLAGYYYQYDVTNDGVTKKVLDPYAKSMAEFTVNTKGETGPDGDNVGKAAIVDLSGTNPSADYNFGHIDGYKKREDAIVYEVHVRDFTSDPTIAGDLNARFGTFSAFKDKLSYLKSLGITHIQLMPVMAWYYGDESRMGEREDQYSTLNNEYNWGYDPHSYFSPDGAYSENAKDPQLRIKELKGLIDAVHDEGMGVILDVVYTHMAKASFLNDIVPNYYGFQDPNGNNLGDFGNNLATTHKMAEKLMVDSVKYWFNEYKIDGMRWDMMGDATYEAVQNAYDAAKVINPNLLFIGEGWRTFKGDIADPALAGKGATQDWMDKTDSVGVFSDEIRNELKSGYGSEGEPRFLTGGARNIQTILSNIKAQPSNTPADDPGDMVPYIEAHDNLPLYDIIAQSIKKDPSIPANNLEIHKRVRLGNLLMMTSQGTAFLHAGQEYGRTKQWLGAGVPEQKYHELKDQNDVTVGYLVHDSYDSTDAINKFDWQKATNAVQYPVNHVTQSFTSGLLALRKHTDAFRLGERDLVNSNVTLIESKDIKEQDLVIGYKNKATDGTGTYYVFVNGDSSSRTLALSENLTVGTVLVDNDEAGVQAVTAPSGFTLTSQSITIDPLTAVIIQVKDGVSTTPTIPTTPTTPTNPTIPTTPTTPTTPAASDIQSVDANDLVKGIDGKVTVQLKDGFHGASLPIDAAAVLASNNLEITAGGVTIALPNKLLASLQARIPAGEASGARIVLEARPLKAEEAKALLDKAKDSQTKVNAASLVYEFSLSIITKDGKTIKVSAFDQPITLAFNVNANADGELAGIYHVSDNGDLAYIGGSLAGDKATAQVSHFSKYAVLEYDKSFTDVAAGHWASQAIKALAAKQIVTGVNDQQFAPKANVTRAEFAAMLVRALGIQAEGTTAFTDVPAGKWYAPYVATASKLGIVQGRTDKTFAPNDTVSREEMAAMLVRAYVTKTGQEAPAASGSLTYSDKGQISVWAAPSVEAAASLGLIQGNTDGTFMPKGTMARAESAQAIYNLLKKF